MMALPTVVTSAGLQPQQPDAVRAELVANVAATNPGYTDNLPMSLIEDIASTDVAAVLLADSFRVDLVNSLTPYGANVFLLNQLGTMLGITLGLPTNTSVFVQFVGTPGFVVGVGFTVSDGTYQYVVTDGGVVGSDRGDGLGVSALLFAVATQTGTWAVPSGTVSSLITSVPNTVALTVNNPQAGIPATETESEESYRSRVIDAELSVVSSMMTMLKTSLANVSGVQTRLISVIQLPANAGWEIIVGGGDPYQVGYAIASSGIDIASLVGSTISVASYTKANPGVITTSLNHGLTNGQTATISGSNPTNYNGSGTVTVIDQKTFSIAVNSTSFPTYVSGGVVTPNNRNISVSINSYPDTYTIPYVSPPQQSVTMTVTWNTSLSNFVSQAAVAQAAAPAIATYINSIQVGQPINLLQAQAAFLASIASILDQTLVTRLVFSVAINGVSTIPVTGTDIINGDPESYFNTSSTAITVVQG